MSTNSFRLTDSHPAEVRHLLGYPVSTLLQLLGVGLYGLGITLVGLYVFVRETIQRDAYWQELVSRQ